jgi:hypothetical protein
MMALQGERTIGYLERARLKIQARRDSGLCVNCAEPAVRASRCAAHWQINSERQKEQYRIVRKHLHCT